MFSISLFLVAAALCPEAPPRHTPHDGCHGLAAARLEDGRVVLLALDYDGRTVVSWDEGVSWQALPGPIPAIGHGWDVVWHPGLQLAGGGRGAFLVAQESGMRAWDPISGAVLEMSGDLPAGDRFPLDVAAPRDGDGPAVLITEGGGVYLLEPATLRWRQVLDTGFRAMARHARVAITPHFRPGAPSGPERALAATIRGVLFLSTDGGSTWARHWQFWSPATKSGDWLVSALAFADDYAGSGILLLGRSRELPGGGSEGEIWRSDDFGGSFQLVQGSSSGVYSLLAAPPGPGGHSLMLAAGRDFPDVPENQGQGLLRSEDGGRTWQDDGNGQDFLREGSRTDRTGWRAVVEEQELAIHPDWPTTGTVFYARQQGLWRSDDEGRHWLPLRMRTEREMRDVAGTMDADGSRLVFGTSYGGGMVAYNLDKRAVASLGWGSSERYGRRLAVSPSFAADGTVAVADSVLLGLWFDPRKPPANVYSARGWFRPPARDGQGGFLSQDARNVAFSTHYGPAGDQTLFWSTWSLPGVVRSEDGAVTGTVLDLLAGGGTIGEVLSLDPAPDYNPSGGGKGLYAAAGEGLYRLEGGVWHLVANLGAKVERIAVDPSWQTGTWQRIFVVLVGSPHVVSVLDDPAGAVVTAWNAGLPPVAARDLAFHPDFTSGRHLLYLAAMGDGVWRLDLDGAGGWEPLGTGFPAAWAKSVCALPGAAGEALVAAGTPDGLWWLEDRPGAIWETIPGVWFRDDSDSTIATFAPADPANPRPDRVWPWRFVNRAHLADNLQATGPGVLIAEHDGSWLATVGVAREWSFATVAGPVQGAVRLEARSFPGQQLLASTVQELQAPTRHLFQVRLSLPAAVPVLFRAEVQLDPGEEVVFDGLGLRD